MRRTLYRWALATSVVVLAAAGANCGGSSEKNVLGPSSMSDSASSNTAAVSANGKSGGKPGGGGGTSGGSSLTLVMYTDNNGNGLPNWNDTVTFKVSTSATASPYVKLACTQNGKVVASASAGFFDNNPFSFAQLMPLSSQAWTGGAAECTADLGYYNNKGTFVGLTSLSFHVDA